MSWTYNPIGSFKAEIWHKVEEKVPKQSGSIDLHKSFSQGKYCTQFCLFVLANQMQLLKYVKLRFLATFGTCVSSQMPSWRLKYGKKLGNTFHSRFKLSTTLHKSLLQAKYVEYCIHVIFECLFWPIKCMHSKPGFWGHFSHVFTS